MKKNSSKPRGVLDVVLAIACTIAGTALALPSANAQAASNQSQGSLADTFNQREKDWRAMVVKHDTAGLDQYMTRDAVLVTPRAGVVEREQWLHNLQQMQATSYELEPIRVKVYGDAAVVTCKWTLAGGMAEHKINLEGVLTDVWVKQDGAWKLALRQGSPLPTTPPGPTP